MSHNWTCFWHLKKMDITFSLGHTSELLLNVSLLWRYQLTHLRMTCDCTDGGHQHFLARFHVVHIYIRFYIKNIRIWEGRIMAEKYYYYPRDEHLRILVIKLQIQHLWHYSGIYFASLTASQPPYLYLLSVFSLLFYTSISA